MLFTAPTCASLSGDSELCAAVERSLLRNCGIGSVAVTKLKVLLRQADIASWAAFRSPLMRTNYIQASAKATPSLAAATATSKGAAADEKTESKSKSTAPAAAARTSVTLSAAAQASQEASEAPAQTAQEARRNDPQAQRLVAKQAAIGKAYSGH